MAFSGEMCIDIPLPWSSQGDGYRDLGRAFYVGPCLLPRPCVAAGLAMNLDHGILTGTSHPKSCRVFFLFSGLLNRSVEIKIASVKLF